MASSGAVPHWATSSPRHANTDSGRSPSLEDLRSLSAAIMAAVERAESISQEADNWLTIHQKFGEFELMGSVNSETEGRIIEMQKLTILSDLDLYLDQITQNAPPEQARQLESLISSTKQTFNGATENLRHFLARGQAVQRAYEKYKTSADSLSHVLVETSQTLEQVSLQQQEQQANGHTMTIPEQLDALRSSRTTLTKMRACLRSMKEAMSGIESLTLTVCDLGLADYIQQYKKRRSELTQALNRLEKVQAELEKFSDRSLRVQADIDHINRDLLLKPVGGEPELSLHKSRVEEVRLTISEMSDLAESLREQGAEGRYEDQLGQIKDGYQSMINVLSEAQQTLVDSMDNGDYLSPLSVQTGTPRSARSPRTKQASIRSWLRSKTDELKQLVANPFSYKDNDIQLYWHSIQQYQGELVTKAEDLSAYSHLQSPGQSEEGWQDKLIEQITPLIDSCADLSYKLDQHARLCVQYQADLKSLEMEVNALTESKVSLLQTTNHTLNERLNACSHLLEQVTSCRRRSYSMLQDKLAELSQNLVKSETVRLHTQTSELDARVSKLNLELKAFQQSLEVSITYHEVLTVQIKELVTVYSQSQREVLGPTHYVQPITVDNLNGYLQKCEVIKVKIVEKQKRLQKTARERETDKDCLPLTCNQTLQLQCDLDTRLQHVESLLSSIEESEARHKSLLQLIDTLTDSLKQSNTSMYAVEKQLSSPSAAPGAGDLESHEATRSQCKALLREGITKLEQAEISLEEAEQCVSGVGLGDLRARISECRQKYKHLSDNVSQAESRWTAQQEQNKHLQFLMKRFDDWLHSAWQVVSGDVTLHQNGLDDMRHHIVSLHDIESSLETTHSWLADIKKAARTYSQQCTKPQAKTLMDSVSARESNFKLMKDQLSERIQHMSAEMESVISWLHRSSEFSDQIHAFREIAHNLIDSETNDDSIATKVRSLEELKAKLASLSQDVNGACTRAPKSVTQNQISQINHAKEDAELLQADIMKVLASLQTVNSVWTNFSRKAAELRGHLNQCQDHMRSVETPGVSLGARKERFQEVLNQLQNLPGGNPASLGELLMSSPFPSPGLQEDLEELRQKHEELRYHAQEGQQKYELMAKSRSDFESSIQHATASLSQLKSSVEQYKLNAVSAEECQRLLDRLDECSTEMGNGFGEITRQIETQRSCYRTLDEAMTLDTRELLEAYQSAQKSWMSSMQHTRDRLSGARELCHHVMSTLEATERWIQGNEVEESGLTAERLEILEAGVKAEHSNLSQCEQYTNQMAVCLTSQAEQAVRQRITKLQKGLKTRATHIEKARKVHQKAEADKRGVMRTLDSCGREIEGCERRLVELSRTSVRSRSQLGALQERVQSVATSLESTNVTMSKARHQIERLLSTNPADPELLQLSRLANEITASRIPTLNQSLVHKSQEIQSVGSLWEKLQAESAKCMNSLSQLDQRSHRLSGYDLHKAKESELELMAQQADQLSADVASAWQSFVTMKEKEGKLVSQLSSVSAQQVTPQGQSLLPEMQSAQDKLNGLMQYCQNIEGNVDTAMEILQRIRGELTSSSQQIEALLSSLSDDNIEKATILNIKSEVQEMGRNALKIGGQAKSQPEIQELIKQLNQQQRRSEGLFAQALEKAERLKEESDSLNNLTNDFSQWSRKVNLSMSGHIVDTQVAARQQDEMEQALEAYKEHLSEFSKAEAKRKDVNNNQPQVPPSPLALKLKADREALQKQVNQIDKGLAARKGKIQELMSHEANFQAELESLETQLRQVQTYMNSAQVPGIGVNQCGQVLQQLTNLQQQATSVDHQIESLMNSSMRSATSPAQSTKVTRLLEVKRAWNGSKTQLVQLIECLKSPPLKTEPTVETTVLPRLQAELEATKSQLQEYVLQDSDRLKPHISATNKQVLETEALLKRLGEVEQEMKTLRLSKIPLLKVPDAIDKMQQCSEASETLQKKINSSFKRLERSMNQAQQMSPLAGTRADGIDLSKPNVVTQLVATSDGFLSDSHSPTTQSGQVTQSPIKSANQLASSGLFQSSADNKDVEQAKNNMQKLLSSQAKQQAGVSSLKEKIADWTTRLGAGINSEEAENMLHDIRKERHNLGNTKQLESNPSLLLLAHDLDSLELRTIAELRKSEANEGLSLNHQETLQAISQEVAACQAYLEQLLAIDEQEESSDVLQLQMPSIEHRVSKLQRQYQTLKALNPQAPDPAHVAQAITHLMNDLQLLQGRMEVIPEESEGQMLHSSETEMWNTSLMDQTLEGIDCFLEDADLPENNMAETEVLVHLLNTCSTQPGTESFITVFTGLLKAAEQAFRLALPMESISAHTSITTTKNLCRALKRCRFELSSLSSTKSNLPELQSESEELERSGWLMVRHLEELILKESRLKERGEKRVEEYETLDRKFMDGNIDSASLLKQVYLVSAAHESLVADLKTFTHAHLHSLTLVDLTKKLDTLYSQLTDGLDGHTSPCSLLTPLEVQSELLMQALQLQLTADHSIQEDQGSLTQFLSRTLAKLVDTESLSWIRKELFADDKESVDLNIRTKLVALRKVIVQISTDTARYMHQIHPSEHELQTAYKWLATVKPPQSELPTAVKPSPRGDEDGYISAVHEYINESLTYQCELSERSTLLGMLLSSHASSDSETVMLSQSAMRKLHEAKMVAGKSQTPLRRVRHIVMEFTECKNGMDSWRREVELLQERQPGDVHETKILLHKLGELHTRGVDQLATELAELDSKVRNMSSELPSEPMYQRLGDQIHSQLSRIAENTKKEQQATIARVAKRLAELQTQIRQWEKFQGEIAQFSRQLHDLDAAYYLANQECSSVMEYQSAMERASRWKMECVKLFNGVRLSVENIKRVLPHASKSGIELIANPLVDHVNKLSRDLLPPLLEELKQCKEKMVEFEQLKGKLSSLSDKLVQLCTVEASSKRRLEHAQTALNKLRNVNWTPTHQVLHLPKEVEQMNTRSQMLEALLSYIISWSESEISSRGAEPRERQDRTIYQTECHRADRSAQLLQAIIAFTPPNSLKPLLNHHQLCLSHLKNAAQELLVSIDQSEEARILATVQNYEDIWQELIQQLVPLTEKSQNDIQQNRALLSAILHLSNDLGTVRATVPELSDRQHQDQLVESQATVDVLTRKLTKLKPLIENMQSTLPLTQESLKDLTSTLHSDTENKVHGTAASLETAMSKWSDFVQETNIQLDDLVEVEALLMNSEHLTLELLLEHMTQDYHLRLTRANTQITKLLIQGESLLPLSGEMYETAVNHSLASLTNALKHTQRLAVSRKQKLKETLAAILEFESGMFSLRLWLSHTEETLRQSPTDWSDSSFTKSEERLREIERSIESHSTTVTAVVNLCTVLESDRDASYSVSDRKLIHQVSDKLQHRWNALCDRLMEYRHYLSALSSAWTEVRDQISMLEGKLQTLQAACQPTNQQHGQLKPANHREKIRLAMKEVESLHDEMKLLNQRYRCLVRQNMVDSSGRIKEAVNACNELWDETYHKLTHAHKSMADKSELWMEFQTKVATLLAAISSLSLALKTQKKSRDEVSQALETYWAQIDEVLCDRGSELREGASIDDSVKLDKLVSDLQASLDMLKSELNAEAQVDTTQQVEDSLNKSFQRSEDLVMRELEETDTPPAPTNPSPTISEAASQHSHSDTRLSDIERRVSDAERRSRLRRKLKLSPAIDQMACQDDTGSVNGPDSTPFQKFLSARSRSSSIDHGSIISDTSSLMSAGRCHARHLANQMAAQQSPASTIQSPSSVIAASALKSPASVISTSTLKSPTGSLQSPLSTLRTPASNNSHNAANSTSQAIRRPPVLRRFRSVSSDRSSTRSTRRSLLPSELFSPPAVSSNAQSYHSSGLGTSFSSHDNKPTALSPLTINTSVPNRHLRSYTSPEVHLTPLLTQTSFRGRRGSVGSGSGRSQSSPRSSNITTLELDYQERMVSEKMQLERDIKNTLEWIARTEQFSLAWSSDSNHLSNPADIAPLQQACQQYNLLQAELNHYKSIILSVNLIATNMAATSSSSSNETAELDGMNDRWSKLETVLKQRQVALRQNLARSPALSTKLTELGDSLMHLEVRLLSGIEDRPQIQEEVRKHLKLARKYNGLFTPIVNAEKEGPLVTQAGKPLLETLKSSISKCEMLIGS